MGTRTPDPWEDIIAALQAGSTLPSPGGEWDREVDPETWVAPNEVKGEDAKDHPLRVRRRPLPELVRTRTGR